MVCLFIKLNLKKEKNKKNFDLGSIQLFDLTTAIELCSTTSDTAALSLSSSHQHNGGPSAADLLKMLDHCDFAATSGQHQNFLSSRPTPCCTSTTTTTYPTATTTATVNYTTALIPSSTIQKEDGDKNN